MTDTAVGAELVRRGVPRRATVRALARSMASAALHAVINAVETRTSPGVSRTLRRVRFEWYVQRLHRRSVRKAAQLAAGSAVRLNLGSGFHPKPGWINVDLVEEGTDLQLDLREPLPFADDSVAAIYSEHFFEHLSYPNLVDSTAWNLESPQTPSEALTLLRECRRVLVPGGRIDIVVPDAEIILEAYVARRERPFVLADWWGPSWCDTPMHRINYLFRQDAEHLYAYDFETLNRVLTTIGFVGVERRAFDPALDHRNATRSLFVRALKPQADDHD